MLGKIHAQCIGGVMIWSCQVADPLFFANLCISYISSITLITQEGGVLFGVIFIVLLHLHYWTQKL